MLFFTPRFIVSSLVTTALLIASPSFANPIESADSTLTTRARVYKSCAGDADGRSFGAYSCCYAERIGRDSAKYRLTVKDTRNDKYRVYGWCRFYSDNWYKDTSYLNNNQGYGKEVSRDWKRWDQERRITHVQAWECVDDQGSDTCKSGPKVTIS